MIGRRTSRIVALGFLVAAPLAAQQPSSLRTRLDAPTYSAVQSVLDSAKKAKLPTKPIENKALEGASSGATGPAIVAAVRQFTKELGVARATLGVTASDEELTSAVSAIDAHVPTADLKRIRRAADKRSIATALTVLSDIAGLGVPPPTASDVVVDMVSHKLKDADLMTFARMVRDDIAKGADPTTIAKAHANGLIVAAGRPQRGMSIRT